MALVIVLIVCVLLFFVLKRRETFTQVREGICSDATPCDAAIIASLMGCPTFDNTALKIYAPSPIHMEELKKLKVRVTEAAVASLRGANAWAIFYTGPEFTGQAFLVPVGEDLTYYVEDGDGLKSTAALRDFVREFGFYYGRRFSCVIPVGRAITLTPIPGGGYPNESVVLGPGTHPQVIYGKGPLLTVATSGSDNDMKQ